MSSREPSIRSRLHLDARSYWRVPVAALVVAIVAFGLVHGALTVRELSGFLRTGNGWVGVVERMTLRTPVRAPLFSVIVLATAGAAADRTRRLGLARSLLAGSLLAFGLVFGASVALLDYPLYSVASGSRIVLDVAWYAATLALLLGVGGLLLARGVRVAAGWGAGR